MARWLGGRGENRRGLGTAEVLGVSERGSDAGRIPTVGGGLPRDHGRRGRTPRRGRVPIGCITVLFAVLAARQAGAAPRAAEIPPKVEESAYRACGVNCVYAICGILGTETRLERVRALLRPRPDGRNSLAELASGMRELGFVPVLARLDPLRISLVTPPAILHVKQLSGDAEGNHFLVYLGRTEGGSVAVLDPPNPPEAIPAKRLEAVWTGVVLIPCKSAADAQATRAALGQSTWVWWADVWFWTACVLVVTLLLVLTRGEPARRLAKAR